MLTAEPRSAMVPGLPTPRTAANVSSFARWGCEGQGGAAVFGTMLGEVKALNFGIETS